MRIYVFLVLFIIGFCNRSEAQATCGSFDYQQQELKTNPLLKGLLDKTEGFIQQQLQSNHTTLQRGGHLPLVTIPVVVHILYNQSTENITDLEVANQLEILNQHFRRLHADTTKTPSRFLSLAADCDIEFKLAISDSKRRATTGIIRKYTPVTKWDSDDLVKFSAQAGDDAWDAASYMNIWVCNLNRLQGYASMPGGPADKDGIVLNYNIFRYNRIIIHEAGHWLGLKHIWGDTDCGDDGVADTPKQGSFTMGCPSGIRLSCNNGPAGDMYMNYMDLTSDACTNLFTEGQKERMRAVLNLGGPRFSLLASNGLKRPTNNEIPVAEEQPKWFHPALYPNPSASDITLDLSYDVRWIGKLLTVTSVQGLPVMQVEISAKVMRINTAGLKPGIYFLTARKEDGAVIKHKLIKL